MYNRNVASPSTIIMGITAIVLMIAIPITLLIYTITLSALALYAFHLSSTMVSLLLAPDSMRDCDSMVECKGEETDKIKTVVMVCSSLFIIASYIMGAIGFEGIPATLDGQIAWAVIFFYPCFCLPIAWLVCRAYERYTKANMAKESQAAIGSQEADRPGYFILEGEDTRESPEVFDEVYGVFRSQGIVNDSGVESLGV